MTNRIEQLTYNWLIVSMEANSRGVTTKKVQEVFEITILIYSKNGSSVCSLWDFKEVLYKATVLYVPRRSEKVLDTIERLFNH
jgi:hypothetical protein